MGRLVHQPGKSMSNSDAAGCSGADGPSCRLPLRPGRSCTAVDVATESRAEDEVQNCQTGVIGNATRSKRKPACAQVKSSGVRGVRWNSRDHAWEVQIRWKGRPQVCRLFNPAKHHMPGLSWEEAEKRALDAAMTFRETFDGSHHQPKRKREQLVPQVWECNPEQLGNRMVGVSWHKKKCCWRAYICVNKKLTHGGYFIPKDGSFEEVEKARQLAIQRRRALEQQRYEQGDVLMDAP